MADHLPSAARETTEGRLDRDPTPHAGEHTDRFPAEHRPPPDNHEHGNREPGTLIGAEPCLDPTPATQSPGWTRVAVIDGDMRPAAVAARAAPGARQSYAAIDLGTNNCRLLIARPAGDNFVVVDAFSRVVRLGEGLAQTGVLSDAAMDRAVGALRICADKLRRRNVTLARSVATEACRRASNGHIFIERVLAETGIHLDVISAREEARLAVLGCHILLEPGHGPALVFDIGGGSTELVLIESGPTVPKILDWVSVPWGVVSLTETCGEEGTSEADRASRYQRMKGMVADSFAPFGQRIAPVRDGPPAPAGQRPPLRLLGTSGTVTTLASVHLDLPQYDRSAVDGLVVPAGAMRAISARLSDMAIAQRRELPCIGRDRADLVVAGCAILEAILDLWPSERLGVADRGIREGILRSLISAGDAGERAKASVRQRIQER
jgi:exopolyphosphatase/guanosine-5'-triphosphate,3'-diphosphate pyrophosphatase